MYQKLQLSIDDSIDDFRRYEHIHLFAELEQVKKKVVLDGINGYH